MNLTDNIIALREKACHNDQDHLKDVHYLATRATEDDHDFLDTDNWGRWDSWNDWGAAS